MRVKPGYTLRVLKNSQVHRWLSRPKVEASPMLGIWGLRFYSAVQNVNLTCQSDHNKKPFLDQAEQNNVKIGCKKGSF